MLTDLTDDELTALLRTAYTDAVVDIPAPVGLAATVRACHTKQRRRLVIGAALPTAAITTAALASLYLGGHETAPSQAAQPASAAPQTATTDHQPTTGIIQLAGYTFNLPASYNPQVGSCTIALPNGTTRRGTPGAHGACMAIWQSTQPPSWTLGRVSPVTVPSGSPDKRVLATVEVWQGKGQITETLTEFYGDGSKRYIIDSATVPDSKAITLDQISTMLRQGTHAS